MSKKANPTLVGAFVVGAIAIGVAGLFFLGAKTLFHRTHPFVLFFEGDVNGLSVGSPVKFQGVPIGEVTGIRLRITSDGVSTRIPVTIELDENVIERASGVEFASDKSGYERSVEQGLRGRLEIESLVTGQRYVALLMDPESPADLVGESSDLREIPTVPTTTQELQRVFMKFRDLDVEGVFEDLAATVKALREIVDSPELGEAPRAVRDTLGSLQQTLKAIEGSFANADSAVDSIQAAAEDMAGLQAELAQTLQTARSLMDQRAPLIVQLQATLQEIGSAARSLRTLADTLERDPSSLVRGRDTTEER
jgi:paraquat-inducible protein B